MFKTNEYFEGKVKSIAFKAKEGLKTIGVMAEGEYTFETTTVEYMTVTSGIMEVQLPDKSEWTSYRAFETFVVEANTSFNVKVNTDTSYVCFYK